MNGKRLENERREFRGLLQRAQGMYERFHGDECKGSKWTEFKRWTELKGSLEWMERAQGMIGRVRGGKESVRRADGMDQRDKSMEIRWGMERVKNMYENGQGTSRKAQVWIERDNGMNGKGSEF
jgi:hypothetical protein